MTEREHGLLLGDCYGYLVDGKVTMLFSQIYFQLISTILGMYLKSNFLGCAQEKNMTAEPTAVLIIYGFLFKLKETPLSPSSPHDTL